jgi:hypothetical protein
MTSAFDYEEGEKFNKKQAEKARIEREEFRQLLMTEIGRKHVFKVFEESFIFSTTFTKSSESFFNEGKRAAALRLFNSVLDLDPYIFAEMCVEFRNGDKKNQI